MIIEIGRRLTVKFPTEEFENWIKSELTLYNPEYAKKQRMGLWLGKTPQYIDLYDSAGYGTKKVYHLPYGCLKLMPDEFTRNSLQLTGHHATHLVDYSKVADMGLYDYQITAVHELERSGMGILQAPTGSGKTTIAIGLIKSLGLKTLWLTHTHDLLEQSYKRASQYISESLLGKITEGKVNIGTGITFATVQTMCKLDLRQYENEWDVIVVDECHRAVTTATSVTMFGMVLNGLYAPHKYGLSATVHRADGLIKATYALIGNVAHTIEKDEVANHVMQVGICPIETGVSSSIRYLNTDGTLNYARLINYLAEDESRCRLIVSKIEQNENKASLILSDRLNHLKQLMHLLPPHMREQAVMITGSMNSKQGKGQRDKALDDMRGGEKKYLFATYALAKEGLDIPCLERLYLATPQKDYAVITQSIGRVARTYEGKANPIAYDFVDNIPFLIKFYKKRCAVYRKNDCYFVSEDQL